MTGFGPRRGSEADREPAQGLAEADPAEPAYWREAVTQGEAVRAADMVELETRYREKVARQEFDRGRELGRAEHVAEADAAMREHLSGPLDPEMVDTINKAAATAHQQAEEARWGPGGRYGFAEPRAGDYQGGPVPWDSSRQPEPEHDAAGGWPAGSNGAAANEPERELEAEAG